MSIYHKLWRTLCRRKSHRKELDLYLDVMHHIESEAAHISVFLIDDDQSEEWATIYMKYVCHKMWENWR